MAQLHQEFDDLRNNQVQNTIPSSPSYHTVQDLIMYDNRRSSTPKNKKSNAWNRGEAVSPKAPSLLNFISSPKKKKEHTAPKKNTKADVVMRKTGNNRNNRRPRSLFIESSTQKELREQILSENKVQYHSDTEVDDNSEPVFTQEDQLNIPSSMSIPIPNSLFIHNTLSRGAQTLIGMTLKID